MPATTTEGRARDTLSAREATRVALYAQGMRGPRRVAGPTHLVSHLRAVQLDTISVLARSHELVAYARLGAVTRRAVEDAYWGPGSETFEYWSHAACVVPLDLWPAFAAHRRARAARGHRWHELADRDLSCARVRDQLRAEGPQTTAELGGARRGGEWWDWSESKIAVEWLLDVGEVVCRERRSFARVYDLAERAIPAELAAADLDDRECARTLVESAGQAMGVATAADLAAYHGLKVSDVRAVIADTTLRPVRVDGWRDPAFLSTDAEAGLRPGLRGRTALLSPFDSLAWDRSRLERLFGLSYRLEAYVPAAKRVVGYFAMPVLAGETIVGLVDPKRRGPVLHACHVVVRQPGAEPQIARALREAASWVGCANAVVERVSPSASASALRSPLATG